MEKFLRVTEKFIPKKLYRAGQPVYHYILALAGAVIYRFPSRSLKVVFVTGTKGKSSTVEMINSILEEAGYKTALAGTIRFKIGDKSTPNMHKMTIPGRFFLQKFLRQAANDSCDYAVIEMTSEGARQYRHKFIDIDGLVFLNLSPEHVESHGSYEKYILAKLSLAHALERSPKPRKVLVANTDDKETPRFFAVKVNEKYPFSLDMAKPFALSDSGLTLTFQGERISSDFVGEFSIYNIMAAATYTLTQNVPVEKIRGGIEKIHEIRGRVQRITLPNEKGKNMQDFEVIVDYAHTPDSLEKLYQAFPNHRKICVLGNTGGGRDTWKRGEMGKIANTYCDSVILTDEDPYDDDPRKIVDEMAKQIGFKPLKIIMDRREAIHEAIKQAAELSKKENAEKSIESRGNAENSAKKNAQSSGQKKIAVLISGKGTDPYIMGANGKKEPWSDASVAQEELGSVLSA